MTKLRGIKRKRTVLKEDSLATRISGKLHHGTREVRKAVKKVKTFETQKLVKRLKSLRTQNPGAKDIADLEAQLEALKHVDHEPIANLALKTKLNKDLLLSEIPEVQAAIKTELTNKSISPTPAGTPTSRVKSRLLSSKTVAVEVRSVIDGLREVIKPISDAAEDEDGINDSELAEEARKAKKIRLADLEESQSSGDDVGSDDGEEHGRAGSEPIRRGDQESGDEWESGSLDDTACLPGDTGGPSGNDSTLTSDEEDAEVSLELDKPSVPLNKKSPKGFVAPNSLKGKSELNSAESTFLPSLSVGFTRGDSDASDWSDGDADLANDMPKKNRRGQRARRAIWEKKYGKNANHVKKQREATMQFPSKSNTRRGGGSRFRVGGGPREGTSSNGRQQFDHPPGDNGWSVHSQPVAEQRPRSVNRQREDKPLHPSWEAKRRLKEKLNPSILPAQGKKITF
ncbi:hypothetical protein AcW1_007570 [Taiwanofungus camphoratus]|nr:hypothetical protein AcW1_007570 [Antrodia cinnamomea]